MKYSFFSCSFLHVALQNYDYTYLNSSADEELRFYFAGKKKVNTIDDFFYVGLTNDRHAEFVPRPIIVMAMDICTPEVVDFLLRFGADLSSHYEGEPTSCACVNLETHASIYNVVT